MKKRLALSFLIVLLIAVLSGCGRQVDPLEAYKEAGIKVVAAKTSHQVMTVKAAAGGMQMSITTDMVVDLGTKSAKGKCTLEVPGLGGALSLDAYLVAGRLYMQAPGVDKYIIYPSDLGDLYQQVDPDKITELVAADSKPTIEDATFTINGKEVKGKKISLTLDTEKLKAVQLAKCEAASAESRQIMESIVASFENMAPTVPLTGYIDADGYLARLELKTTVTQDGTEVTSETVVECFDFGQPVDIQAPAFTAANTITLEQLMQGVPR